MNKKIEWNKSSFRILAAVLIIFSAGRVPAQFGPDVRLTNNTGNSLTSPNNSWCVASSGTVVHAVWRDNRDGNDEIYYKRSTNNGTVWGGDTRLTNNTASSRNPSVSVSGNIVHIVWVDRRTSSIDMIYYKRSTDAGATWGSDLLISENCLPVSATQPSVTSESSNVNVVWRDERNGNFEIYFKSSQDDGASWNNTDTRLSVFNGNSLNPAVSISGTVCHSVFADDRFSVMEIYYRRSSDGGISWENDTVLTGNSSVSDLPSVSSSGLFVYVTWTDTRDGSQQIYFKRSTNSGESWEPDTRVTSISSAASKSDASVSSSGQVVHLVWRDERHGNPEIYYARSQDGGLTWNSETRLTNSTGNSLLPSVSVSGSAVHVVWQDNRDGNNEIYYKQDLSGNVLPVSLGNFSHTVNKNTVTLMWQTITELNNSGFEIQRKRNGEDFVSSGNVKGSGTTNLPVNYFYTDTKLRSGKYIYRLKQTDYNGNFEYFQLSSDVQVNPPGNFEMSQNYPNPSNPKCKINFEMPVNGKVTIKLYDITGSEVYTLLDETREADYYTIDFEGSNIASGVYFYRIIASGEGQNYTKTMKMVIVK